MHADFDREHDRLIQVDIHGDTRDIPHSLRIAAAAQAVDDWKRPIHATNACWLVESVDLPTVAAWLGHGRLDTVRIYSQPDEAALERASAALELR